jgi:hypothetical protein
VLKLHADMLTHTYVHTQTRTHRSFILPHDLICIPYIHAYIINYIHMHNKLYPQHRSGAPAADAAKELGVLKLHADMLQAKLAEVEAFKRALQTQITAAGSPNSVAATAISSISQNHAVAQAHEETTPPASAAHTQQAATMRPAIGKPRCCDDGCTTVAVDCPMVNSASVMHDKNGEIPNKSTLMQWLEKGTPEQRKEAANLLYEERHGAVIKDDKGVVSKSEQQRPRAAVADAHDDDDKEKLKVTTGILR